MNWRRWLRRPAWRAVFRLGRRKAVHGVDVRVLLPDVPHAEVFSKLEAALCLLARYSPQSLARLKGTSGILVFGLDGPNGEWHREARLVKLSETYVTEEHTHPAHVAATLVHETAHAWLEGRGVRYTADRRRRIEGICVRAEARFARRLPGGDELSAYYEDRAARIDAGSDEEWSNEAFRRRNIAALVALNTPRWLLKIFGVREEEIAAVGPNARVGPGSIPTDNG